MNPRDLSIGDAIAAEAAADRLARLQRLVIGLVRYGVLPAVSCSWISLALRIAG